MLPFHKRTAKKTDDLAEDLATGDIYEVIKAPHAMAALRAPKSQFPSAPSSRPRVFNNHYPDEVTTLMPAKGLDSFPAPPPSAPARSMPRTPTPARSVATKYQTYQRPSTQTNYRPMAGMPVQTIAPIPVAPNSLSPMAMPRSDSDAGSIPGTVITTRTKLLGRPTMSWSAALVAMGIFAGLVTAVVARGDGDALVDATAAFVDPGHASSTNASQMAAAVQAPLMPMSLTSPTPVVAMNAAPPVANVAPVLPAPSAVIPPTVAMSDIPVMSPKARPAPIAFAAPAAKHEVKAAPPAVKHEAAPVAAAPKAEKPAVAAAPKASKKGAAKGDLDAEAANALAQAQLAQSL